jgi:hypothetical protein
MPGAPQDTSFIPKNNPNRRKRTARQGNLYILTIISYVIFFSALIGSIALFFYYQLVQSQFDKEVIAMNEEVASFKQADMEKVLDFDERLRKAADRVEHSVSVTSIFKAIEAATAQSIQFISFQLTRNLDEGFTVEATLQTDSFDSSRFQRNLFEDDTVIETIEIKDLAVADAATESGEVISTVSFVAQLGVPLAAVPYVPAGTSADSLTPPPAAEPVSETLSPDVDLSTPTTSASVIDDVVLVEATGDEILNEPAL